MQLIYAIMQDSCIWENLKHFSSYIFLSTVCKFRKKKKVLVAATALWFATKNFCLGQNELHFLFWIAQGISVFLEFSTSFFNDRAGNFNIVSVQLLGVLLFLIYSIWILNFLDSKYLSDVRYYPSGYWRVHLTSTPS